MKLYTFIILFINISTLYAQGLYTNNYGLVDKSLAYLHDKFSKSDNEDIREWMQNRVVIMEDGNSIYLNNPYLDNNSSKIIGEKITDYNFFDRKNLKKLYLKDLKINEFWFWKVTITYSINKKVLIIFDEYSAFSPHQLHPYGVALSKNSTVAYFVYKYNSDKGNYDMESVEIGRK